MCELDGVTTIEGAPDSKHADVYRQLAINVIANKNAYIPKPFEAQNLSDWASSWGINLIKEDKIGQEGIQSHGGGV
jgi:nitrogenase iron protein NifH